jgi:DNA-binding transcriptional ArsR family regulator
MGTEKKLLSPDDMARNAEKAEALLKQLANAQRLRMLCALVAGQKSVGELSELCNLAQSAVSQHLTKMRKAGLVDYKKTGQTVHYYLVSMEAQALLSTLYLIYCRK